METAKKKDDVIARLRSEILSLQGFRPPALGGTRTSFGLDPIEKAFPGGVFPTGAIHEFISNEPEQAAATSGFMAALAGCLMKTDGMCAWIGTGRNVFPLGLKPFGLSPDRIIFIDLKRERDSLWAIEEALKCDAFCAVVGQIKELNLTESRRLQLAVEESRVTGLIHRKSPRISSAVASVCRWKVSPLAARSADGLPGVGYACWNISLIKVRNGEPGNWRVQWAEDHFEHISQQQAITKEHLLQVG
ncbi:ImuA family protein [Dyadobacter sp. 22481]|uniref:ImuA family protein n=1 Tax=Dyadobacter sp. 22481 TaxID=3453926 RepID=UPI003F86A3F8